MSDTIEHRVDRRIPGLFITTLCGLELGDYGTYFKYLSTVRTPVPPDSRPLILKEGEIPTISFIQRKCHVCNDLYESLFRRE